MPLAAAAPAPAHAAAAPPAAAAAHPGGARTDEARLNGHWAPFGRCPVDDPAMLAADGEETVASCVSSVSAGGSITLGRTTARTGANNLQFGVVYHTTSQTFTVVPPPAGSIVGAPTEIPGGLLGLMCPGNLPVVTEICRLLTDNSLNRVTATVESVGAPTGFSLTAGLSAGEPIVTLPVRIRLRNPFLGSQCFIGSAADPIVLRPRNAVAPAFGVELFRGDGTPDEEGEMVRFALTGTAQEDRTFAVPRARGCGALGLLSGALDLKTGLPSPAGRNSLVLDAAVTHNGALNAPGLYFPDAGRQLARFRHSAVLP
ncbi:secreted protein [Streptomyces clavuligerus]|nr:secreted protein [Streptomyces clavuligerus]